MSETFRSNLERHGITEESLQRRRILRRKMDVAAKRAIAIGGVSIIFAICLIFFYLAWEVLPLFRSASISVESEFVAKGYEPSVLALEEQNQVALSVNNEGLHFLSVQNGQPLASKLLSGRYLWSHSAPDHDSWLGFGYEDASLVYVEPLYQHIFDGKRTQVLPKFEEPIGSESLSFGELAGVDVQLMTFRKGDDQMVVAFGDGQGVVSVLTIELSESLFGDELTVDDYQWLTLPRVSGQSQALHMSLDQRWLYVIGEDRVSVFNLDEGKFHQDLQLEKSITASAMLNGGISLLLGDESGMISQHFLVKNSKNKPVLTKIREFDLKDQPIEIIVPEIRRKGFYALDAGGHFTMYSTTANEQALEEKLEGAIQNLALSPRGNGMIAQLSDGRWQMWSIDNEHPDVSLSSLWDQVWYESYREPEFIWQSSSASTDFEPKLSIMPLVFGTLKAAMYAMLLAIPLAVCAAAFTAQFMSPGLRKKVKPTIELMEALPTVILGFLAGLWLAPLIETNLAGIFSLLAFIPIMIVALSWLWFLLPPDTRNRLSISSVSVVLIPVIILGAWLSFKFGAVLEGWLFDGNMARWLRQKAGIPVDQRNALVVALAMGFAVIPTIYSITEDALFAVPKNLTYGSLALGANQWQTMVRVVLPTASPGIFSAIMIGFGRAVGETMIVLMATGNTPVMEMNIFEGLRTLSANIAVEMGEAEVGSSHFRVLFLTGLVLFVFTFILNTTAEVVRQRLRKKYGAL